MYRLYKGFGFIGKYEDIYQTIEKAPRSDGVYNLYKDGICIDSWQIVNGTVY